MWLMTSPEEREQQRATLRLCNGLRFVDRLVAAQVVDQLHSPSPLPSPQGLSLTTFPWRCGLSILIKFVLY